MRLWPLARVTESAPDDCAPHDGPAGPEGHAAIMQAQERGETEVAPYFLHVPTRAEVERVRKRSHKSDAAAPALAEE